MNEHKNTAQSATNTRAEKETIDNLKVPQNEGFVKLSPEAESKLNDLAMADPVGTMLDLFNAMRPHDLHPGTKIKLSCHGYTVSVRRADISPEKHSKLEGSK
jgi:hypothetical protein